VDEPRGAAGLDEAAAREEHGGLAMTVQNMAVIIVVSVFLLMYFVPERFYKG